MLPWLARDSLQFPPLEFALREPNGLLAAGGDLSSERLIAAYRHGCFPWNSEGQPLLWWSPDPRTVLCPEDFHCSRSLARLLRRSPFEVRFDQDFAAVIRACAEPRARADGTWISPAMQAAYIELHRLGIAHSVEVYERGQLVGGLYGLAMGALFFGESMFSRRDSASKVAFAHLVRRVQANGCVLIDCQMHSAHLHSLGARDISRHAFADQLRTRLDAPDCWGRP